MYENELMNRIYAYAIYAACIAILIVAVLLGSVPALLISAFVLLLSVAYLHSGHIINSYLLKRSKVIEICNGYRLGLDLGYVTKRFGRTYSGAAIALLQPKQQTEIRNVQMADLLETIKDPFEFSVALSAVDKKRLLEPLETKKRMKEITLARIKDGPYDKINSIKREIEFIDAEISHLLKNGSSFDIVVKLKATAVAENELEAGREAARNIEGIANRFSAALGIDYEILKGEKLIDVVEMS